MGTILGFVAVVVAPTALAYLVLAGLRACRGAVERRRAVVWRRRHAPGPPIERLALDLRRLRAQLDSTENQVARPGKAVRVRALRDAYLDALLTACAELDLQPPEPARGQRVARAEIYRVEAALRSRGLDVRVGV